jgi:hypothetical protein
MAVVIAVSVNQGGQLEVLGSTWNAAKMARSDCRSCAAWWLVA